MSVVNNKAVVQSLSDSLVEPLPIASKDYTVTFASQLASGNAPDVDLPLGTQIEVTVEATNEIGSDEQTSNAVTPYVPAPADSAGPITAVQELNNIQRVWSDNASLSAPHPSAPSDVTAWFNGNPSSGASGAADGTFSITNLGGLDGLVEIYSNGVGFGNRAYSFVDSNGASLEVDDSTQENNTWLSLGVATNLTEINGTSKGGYGVYFTAIRVNGVELIDDKAIAQTSLTVLSSTNLDQFAADDNLKMVDVNGAVASFAAVTSDITDIESYDLVTSNFGTFSSGNYGGPTAPAVGVVPTYGFAPSRTNGYIEFDPPLSGKKIEAWGYTDTTASGEPSAWTINSSKTMTLPGGTSYQYKKVDTGVTTLSRVEYVYQGGPNDAFLPGLLC